MTTRVTSGGLRLPAASFTSQAPAYAETARSLAGRATELYELASGQSSATGEPPVTPPNPQGRTGWDLSGPPWGSALYHPVAGWSGRSSTANLIQPDTSAANDFWYTANRSAVISLRFWNRPHERLQPTAIAPLSRLYWFVRSTRISGTTTPTATAWTWNPRMGQRRATGQTATFTTTATDSTVLSTALWVNALPGWNTVYLEVLCDSGSTVNQLVSGCLQVLAKRTH